MWQLTKVRPKLGKAYAQPQVSRGKTKTGGSLYIITAQQRQNQDTGKPEHNHSSEEERPRPGEDYGQTQPRKGKTGTIGSLNTTTPQQKQNQGQEEPIHNHSQSKAIPRPGEATWKLHMTL